MDMNGENTEQSNSNQQWTEHEMALLEKHYRNFTVAEIQERFLPGRSASAIYGKAHLLKLQQTYTHWTDEDTAALREVYLVEGAEGVHQRLPHHTRRAIRNKAWYLGLRRSTSPRKRWSDEDCQRLMGNMHLPPKELRALFPQYSSQSVSKAKGRLRRGKAQAWRREELDVLKEHYRHDSIWMLQQRFFPLRLLTDIRYKVSELTGDAPPTQPTEWSEEECNLVRQYYLSLDAGKIQQRYLPFRSQAAIRLKARQLGFRKEVHRAWTPSELQVLKDVYPQGAARAVKAILPHRSHDAVYDKARELGLSWRRGTSAAREGKADV